MCVQVVSSSCTGKSQINILSLHYKAQLRLMSQILPLLADAKMNFCKSNNARDYLRVGLSDTLHKEKQNCINRKYKKRKSFRTDI